MSTFAEKSTLTDYVSVSQAAKIIGVSSSLVRRWVRNGTLPHSMAGDLRLLPRSYVETFAKTERKRGPKTA